MSLNEQIILIDQEILATIARIDAIPDNDPKFLDTYFDLRLTVDQLLNERRQLVTERRQQVEAEHHA